LTAAGLDAEIRTQIVITDAGVLSHGHPKDREEEGEGKAP
jgi:hypothetical protein